jgi:diguanylate cyclase (GGDEF)-like protein
VPQRSLARLRAVNGAVVVAGLTALLLVVLASDLSWLAADPTTYGVLSALVLIGALRPILVPRGDHHDSIAVSTTFVLALALIGPLALPLAVQAVAVAAAEQRAGNPWRRVCVDVARHVLTLCAARGVFALTADVPFLHGEDLVLPAELVPALLAGAAFFAVDHLLATLVVALTLEVPVRRRLVEDARFRLTTSGVLLSFAPVAAVAVAETVWLVPLLWLPIAAIHRSAELAAAREREAMHDALTGLPNRELFRMRVARAVEDCERTRRPFGVLLLDLDHFKEINDTLGHQVGDDLIVEVARRVRDNLRPGDTVARLGGDEFAVLTVDLDQEEDGLRVAERLLEALEDPFHAGDVRLDVQASLGLALHPDHGDDVDTLLQHADIALYEAKRERGTVSRYEPTSDDHSPERLALAADLRHALQADELYVEFQPKVASLTGRVVGLEALVRWAHPRRGLLMPDDFLPVVENTGLIVPLTMSVLDKALCGLAQWRATGHDVSVAVNLSARHLTDVDLPRKVETLLRGRGIPASALTLEVTETMVMSDPTRAVAVLGVLRDLGVGVAVDDFGTGYSSLAYLRRLQIDELKIDKSFVQDLATDEGDGVIVRSTIEMGHNLGLRVVAEGVEDESTMQMLRAWRCDVLQGYAISRPLPQDQVADWLDARAQSLTMFGERWLAAALLATDGQLLPEQPVGEERAC